VGVASLTEADFDERVTTYDGLRPDNAEESERRKEMIRQLQGDFESLNAPWFTEPVAAQFLASKSDLRRIAVYLRVESGKLRCDTASARGYVEGEYDRLRAVRGRPGFSRRPLHYALRAYEAAISRERRPLRIVGHLLAPHVKDRGFMAQVVDSLEEYDGSTVLKKARSILDLLPEPFWRRRVVIGFLSFLGGFLTAVATAVAPLMYKDWTGSASNTPGITAGPPPASTAEPASDVGGEKPPDR